MLLILFLYIFMIPIFEEFTFMTTNLIVGLFLFLYFLFNSKYRMIVESILKKKRIFLIFSVLTIIIIYSLMIPTYFGTYDYSMVTTLLNQFINLLVGVLLYSLYVLKRKNKMITHDLIMVFVIQSIIQFVSFISPNINEILNFFRTESVIQRGQMDYGGIRGLSISGSAFFGLGIGYGLILIYYIINWNKISKAPILRIMFFILILFGALSAARISFVGLFIGLIYVLLEKISIKEIFFEKNKKIKTRKIVLFFPISILTITFLGLVWKNGSNDIFSRIESFKKFAFSPLYNYFNKGVLTTSSTNVLFNKMYFSVNAKTFVLGDGWYTKNGSYYMNTDAGYMRQLLFFGVIGLILLLFYQFLFFNWKNKKKWVLNFLIILYILVVHIKGDALGFSIMMQNILFMKYLESILFLKHNDILVV